jgi:hypothetical protein
MLLTDQDEGPELQHHFYFGKARYGCNVRLWVVEASSITRNERFVV